MISEKDALIALVEVKLPVKDDVNLRLQRTALQKERRKLLDQLRKENKTLAPLLDHLTRETAPHLSDCSLKRECSPNGHGPLSLQLADASTNRVKQSLIKVFMQIHLLSSGYIFVMCCCPGFHWHSTAATVPRPNPSSCLGVQAYPP